MGLDLTCVISDDKHYSVFICLLCRNLCSLDALVTNCCHAPFCVKCLDTWVTTAQATTCPKCQVALVVQSANSNNNNNDIGNTHTTIQDNVVVAAQSLETSQPLAYQVLSLVQVACMTHAASPSAASSCEWTGDYRDWKRHLFQHTMKQLQSPVATTTSRRSDYSRSKSLSYLLESEKNGSPTNRSQNVTSEVSTPVPDLNDNKRNKIRKKNLQQLQRAQSMRDFNDDDYDGEGQFDRWAHTSASPRDNLGGPGIMEVPLKSPSPESTSKKIRNHPPKPSMQQRRANRRASGGGSVASRDSMDWSTAKGKRVDENDAASTAPLSMRGEPTAAHHPRSAVGQEEEDDDVSERKSDPTAALATAIHRCDKLKKQANAKFNRGDVAGARLSYTDALNMMEQFSSMKDNNPQVRTLIATLYSNRAVTYFRERLLPPSVQDCNKSLELDPLSEKTYIRKWRALLAMKEFRQASACLEQGLSRIPSSRKLAEELRKAPLQQRFSGNETIQSNTDYMDLNYSVASGSQFVPELMTMNLVTPDQLERSEKLKKQANAKFNKGDIAAARTLYSDAIGCLPNYKAIINNSDNGMNGDDANVVPPAETKELLAMLYSNRAVTYFRDKMYEDSLQDCETAILLDPNAEKSYIRKSRALAGLDRLNEAYTCLERAHEFIPGSTKIAEELKKAREDQENEKNKGNGSEEEDDDEEEAQLKASTEDFGTQESGSSAEFNNSVGSFNFTFTQDSQKRGKNGASGDGGGDDDDDEDYTEELEMADKLKRNANAKFNRGDIAGARLLYTEALACLPNDRANEEVRECLASLYANRAVTFFREKEYGPSTWDCDKAIELDPKSEKSYIRKARAQTAIERLHDAVDTLKAGLNQLPRSQKIQEEISKIEEQLGGQPRPTNPPQTSESDFQVSFSSFEVSQMGNSIASVNFFVTPQREKPTLGAVNESHSEEFALPFDGNASANNAGDITQLMERAEKLKKQANAKLNKGDVAGARVLYGEGLACLPAEGPPDTDEGRELAASLYANRAVTFFREKKFAATVQDCDKSLEYDPKHEKSYIRKWRALMALGNFDDAYTCLQVAVSELPESSRLNEELANATEQKELLVTINELMAAGDYQEARDTLKPIVKTSDNVSFWLAAARADACLGLTDSSLERISKVLLFNPRHAGGLLVRGYAMFLSGEMENGITIIQESLEVDIDGDNAEASEQLDVCQRTFSAFSKGQARAKRGRYKDAVDLFSSAMEDGADIPKEAPLYGLLLTERAEARLLAQQYEDALEDCNEAIRLKNDNMTAWTVKVEVYFALGRLQQARDELAEVRKTWGAGNSTIESAYKKTDFELRLKKADDELLKLVSAVEAGLPEGGLERKLSSATAATTGAASSASNRGSSSRKLLSPKSPKSRRGSLTTTPQKADNNNNNKNSDRKSGTKSKKNSSSGSRPRSTSKRKDRRGTRSDSEDRD